MCLDNLRFDIIPFTFKSSIQIVWFSRISLVVTLCKKSFLWLATCSWSNCSFNFCFSAFLDNGSPFFFDLIFLEKERWILANFNCDLTKCLGLAISSPSLVTANDLIPTSIPIAVSFLISGLLGNSLPSSTNIVTY